MTTGASTIPSRPHVSHPFGFLNGCLHLQGNTSLCCKTSEQEGVEDYELPLHYRV